MEFSRVPIPIRSTSNACGIDVFHPGPNVILKGFQKVKIDLGFRAEIPHGHYIQLKELNSTASMDVKVLGGTFDRGMIFYLIYSSVYTSRFFF